MYVDLWSRLASFLQKEAFLPPKVCKFRPQVAEEPFSWFWSLICFFCWCFPFFGLLSPEIVFSSSSCFLSFLISDFLLLLLWLRSKRRIKTERKKESKQRKEERQKGRKERKTERKKESKEKKEGRKEGRKERRKERKGKERKKERKKERERERERDREREREKKKGQKHWKPRFF